MARQGGRMFSRYVVFFVAVLCSHCDGLEVLGAEDSTKKRRNDADSISYEEKENSSAPEEVSATTVSERHGESMTDDCIKYVNFFRTARMSDPLPTLHSHKTLENYIRSRMNEVAQKNCSELELEMPPGIGATFFATSGTQPSCKKATYSWYRQIHELHGVYPGTAWGEHNVGQFSQMMWESSLFLGCARTANCTKGFHQLVCLYYPAGNVLGEAPFSEDVWQSLVRRHAKWTGADLVETTTTTTTTETPANPSVPYLMESLEKALEEKDKLKEG